MSMLSRREARENLLELLFETEFRSDESYEEIYAISAAERELPDDSYVKDGYFTICREREAIDGMIGRHSNGWKPSRLTRISRSILRLGVYEMMFLPEIPFSVSINEAVELSKKYDDEKAKAFINGILNSVKEELSANDAGKKAEDGTEA